MRRRALHEAVVGEHALRARDLLAQPSALGVDVAVDGRALGLDDGVEDAFLVAGESRSDAGAAEHRRRLLDTLERTGLGVVARFGPRRDDQAASPIGEVRPDLLG